MIDVEDLSEEQQFKLLQELESLNKTINQTYIPHPKQYLFHVAPNRIRAVFGGNRSGKSEMGTNEVRFHATGLYPDWYPMEKRWMYPTRGRIVVTDYRKGATEVIEPKIKQWFGDTIIKIERSMNNMSKVHVRHITGGVSTFDVMTHEQDIAQFQGWSGHWVWFDEPPPRNIYVACSRGMVDFNGRMWITATPLNEPWMFDEIVASTTSNAWHIVVSIHDNPHNKPEAVEAFLSSLTDEERESMEWGKFLHLTGRVYGEFNQNVHLIDSLPPGHDSWPVYFVLDPADRRPHHAVWAKVDPRGTIYVFDEFIFKGTIKQTSEAILVRERSCGIDSDQVIRLLDPNKGQTPSVVSGLQLYQEFGVHGLGFVTDVNDDIATGHLAVKERLHYDTKNELSVDNSPRLYLVRSSTRECVRQILSYVWDNWRGRNSGSKAEKERPLDINKDMPDCLRYLCVFVPTYVSFDKPKTSFFDVDTSAFH